ncbi:hypothetical protein FDP41_000556 [Naegleria fowleri]|uniref:Uncharacterized protein n=1 Tax=Naegleria fowleri TaxID=5763 RepID=A0A6A5C5U4_NAEFO|nr:uncharacterized protein FDP41_000556 [Naegleria fowleri]KAF0984657.1 hypothetical protein FDP41_000556 [Naegleria fowleri]CAG4715295.1 unnamed protein product [Naegleria fowleri]
MNEGEEYRLDASFPKDNDDGSFRSAIRFRELGANIEHSDRDRGEWVSIVENPRRNPFIMENEASLNDDLSHHPLRQMNHSFNNNNNYNNYNSMHHHPLNHQDRYRLNDVQRRLIAERFTTQIMNKLFHWFENTKLFKTSMHYANEWRSKMSKNPSYVMNERALSNPLEARYYNYSHYNQESAIYSRHESFIRNIVDSIITFRKMLFSAAGLEEGTSGTNHSEEYYDRTLAEDIANRIDRYTLQERRGRSTSSSTRFYNNNNSNQFFTQWKLSDRLKQVFEGFLKIFKAIFRLITNMRIPHDR